MCMMLYLGSDNALPIIRQENTEDGLSMQPLSVHKLDESFDDYEYVSEQLSKKFRYLVNSWQGCGCGFHFDNNNKKHHSDSNKFGKQSLEALFEYIRVNVRSDECELFSMWNREPKMVHRTVIDLRDFNIGDSFRFLEGQYITVYKL